MKILLIAGHGAGDPGAVGNGYKEADLTREAVTNIKNHLSAYADVDVFDFAKNMYTYLKSGKKYPFNNYDYIFEVHFNALNGKAYGTEMLVHQNEKSYDVETEVCKNLSDLGFYNRGVKKRADLLVMNTVKKAYGVSHGLIEICFIDNAKDIERYIANKDKVAKAITEGIVKGFGLTQGANSKELTTVNDIVWELSAKGIITDKELWLDKLEKDENAYWLARKCTNYIRGIDG